MIDIDVRLRERGYPVRIGPWRDWDLGRLLPQRVPADWPAVADQKVWEVWGEDLRASFGTAGINLHVLELDAGETAKSHATLFKIYDHLLASRARRDTTLVVFGGGVLGDLAGFAAATYQRGIAYLQIPTTLLAQVDSSVGGKTGLNYGGHKNMIGAFHQPRAVLISPEWLSSLPPREFRAGLAEIIKCGVIRDGELIRILEEEEPKELLRSPRLEELVARALVVKARIVEEDERDLGLRRLLNFGHTAGHALESVTGFSRYLHGEAVAVGMIAALRLSVSVAGLAGADADRVERLLHRYGLPVRAEGVDPEKLFVALEMDKKVSSDGGAWVLTDELGKATVTAQVPSARIRDALHSITEAQPT